MRTRQGGLKKLQIPSTSPDFLMSAMGSKSFMRLSLMKAAHEVIFGAAW
jgi:hypothetical protein